MHPESRRSGSIVCPCCGSACISKSKRKGLTEFLLHTFLFTSVYRCMGCGFRFFRFRLLHRLHAPAKSDS
jgi:DNA-directed RNA polymerase subunit RPC12/RpoP